MSKEKYVYKITNQVNGKIYIGQTNNIKRRLQEHKHDKRKNKPIHSAIRKYGWENFKVDTLYFGANYNEMEKYYISLYETQNKTKGYNIVAGGQDSSGEDNPAAVLKQKQVDDVIHLLHDTNLSCNEISKRTGVSYKNIYNINSGVAWKDDMLSYPIRNITKSMSQKEVEKIYDLLINSNLSYEEIADDIGIKPYTVSCINNGNHYRRDGYKYPLRELDKIKENKAMDIIDLLSNTGMYFKDIASKTGTSISIVSRINQGISWKKDGITYPIRKSK